MSTLDRAIELAARAHAGQTDKEGAIIILPLRNPITAEEVNAACPGTRSICACDFHVQGSEQGQPEAGGLRLGRILNVDHHAPLPRMMSRVTSTRLACEYLAARDAHAAPEPAPWVVINHTDCDSVLSSALVMGYLTPGAELVAASVCGDHTGEGNAIADVLQGLDETRRGDRTEGQFLESLRNVTLLIEGRELERPAQRVLAARRESRAAARRLVEQGVIRTQAGIAIGLPDGEIDGAFFPALLPEAAVIMLVTPHASSSGQCTVKLRLGLAAPDGLTLHSLGVTDWDPAFGGRWNAGSNKRGGGTGLAPAEYARRLRERLHG